MTATSVPGPPGPGFSSPTPRPQRPWTILGRLSKAVREQNWFAVALELGIVVLGVVIGFQVTAWGERQSDREKEQTYLHQLAEDLRETERHIAEVDAWLLRFEQSSGALQRSFYEPSRPHPDTLLTRISGSLGFWKLNAITGTAEALVATGDLALLQNDSLRSAITDYLRVVRYEEGLQATFTDDFQESLRILRAGRSLSGDWDLYLELSAELSPSDPLYPLPRGPRRPSTLLDPEAFLSDPRMEAAAFDIVDLRLDTRGSRERLLDATTVLRERVETEIGR